MAIGILVAWVISIYIGGTLRQFAQIFQVGPFADKLNDISQRSSEVKTRTKVSLKNLDIKVEELSKAVSLNKLVTKGLVSPRISSFLHNYVPSGLDEYLDRINEKINSLMVVLRYAESLSDNWEKLAQENPAGTLKKIDELLRNSNLMDAQTLEKEVQKILGRLSTKSEMMFGGQASKEQPLTSNYIHLRYHQANNAAWIGWGLVTLSFGFVALIAFEPGFGTGKDLFQCFFWGLGIQLANKSLDSLSRSNVSQVFKAPSFKG